MNSIAQLYSETHLAGMTSAQNADRGQPVTLRRRVVVFAFWMGGALLCPMLHAGHSRSGYLDAGQSADGRYVVSAKRIDTLDRKGRPIDHSWTYTWRDRQTGRSLEGRLEALRSGTNDVFDPVNAHIFVAPDGDTFAVWMPQAMARASRKKPADENRDSSVFRSFSGFSHRLSIYKKSGKLLKRFDVSDLLIESDWKWFHFYGCQVYWLSPYPGLSIDTAPRAGYALYRISPDYTVLEFRIGATREAAFHAQSRGITVPEPRRLRVRLTDGAILSNDGDEDKSKLPVQPFVGELCNRGLQHRYVPSLDPLRSPGQYVAREKNDKPVIHGLSSPVADNQTARTKSQKD